MKNILQNKNAFTKNINSKNNNNGSVKKVRIDIKIISMTFVSFSWFIKLLDIFTFKKVTLANYCSLTKNMFVNQRITSKRSRFIADLLQVF